MIEILIPFNDDVTFIFNRAIPLSLVIVFLLDSSRTTDGVIYFNLSRDKLSEERPLIMLEVIVDLSKY
jgi:hypothetical protein